MRVLITGIGGFIGKHLAGEAMSADKAEVFGTILPGEKADFSGFEKGGLKILECDINDAERLGSIVMEVQPDIVFHLAAIANVYLSWAIPEKTAKVNLLGSLNLLEAVRKYAPDARVLLSSTREVYGAVKKSELPITEKQEPNPMNPYAVSKLAMEMLGRNYCNNYGLKAVILRSFNITGPGRPSEFACSDWAKQVAEIDLGRREPVIETGAVSAVRDFTDVRDAARAFWLAAAKCRAGEPYNMCSGKGYKMGKVLEMVSGISEKKVKTITKKDKIVRIEVPYAVGSNAKLRKATGWKPEIKLEKTLSDLVEYWKSELGA